MYLLRINQISNSIPKSWLGYTQNSQHMISFFFFLRIKHWAHPLQPTARCKKTWWRSIITIAAGADHLAVVVVTRNVYFVSTGTYPIIPNNKLWNVWKTDAKLSAIVKHNVWLYSNDKALIRSHLLCGADVNACRCKSTYLQFHKVESFVEKLPLSDF